MQLLYRPLMLPSMTLAVALVALSTNALAQPRALGMDPTINNSTTSAVNDYPVQTAQAGSYGTGSNLTQNSDGYSWLPYTRKGYVGLNVGKSKFDTACGGGGYTCDDPNASLYVYTGGLINDWVGLELGYLNTGKANRAGGDTRAQGVNVNLVLRAPVGAFNAFVKGGAIYGQTRVSTGVLSNVTAGKRTGWGASYGAGVGYDFTPNSGIVLEVSRNEFRFPGGRRDNVDSTNVGYIYRF